MDRVKAKLSQEQIDNIEAAIKEAEEKTSCEIVPVLSLRADKYLHASFFIGFIFSLIAFALITSFYPFIENTAWDGLGRFEYNLIVIVTMMLSFLIGALLSQYLPVLLLPFISKEEMQTQVRRRAFEAYFNFCRGKTVDNTGIIIYISLFEHIVSIQGDNEVNKHFEQQDWDVIKNIMVKQLQQGQLSEAFIEGIKQTGEFVKQKLPIQENDENELPNELKFI